jgi:hypothetical protein
MPDADARGAAEACAPLPGSATDPAAQRVSTSPFRELRRRLMSSRLPDGGWTPAELSLMQANAARQARELASAPRWDGSSCAACSIVPREASSALQRPPGCPDESHPAAFCGACLRNGAMKIGETAEDAALLASLWCPACREG